MFQRHFHHLLTCCMLFLLHSHRRSHKCVRSSRICLCTWSNSSIHWKHEIRQPFNSVGKSYTFCVTDLSKTRLEESERGKQKNFNFLRRDKLPCWWLNFRIHSYTLIYIHDHMCVFFVCMIWRLWVLHSWQNSKKRRKNKSIVTFNSGYVTGKEVTSF